MKEWSTTVRRRGAQRTRGTSEDRAAGIATNNTPSRSGDWRQERNGFSLRTGKKSVTFPEAQGPDRAVLARSRNEKARQRRDQWELG